jgi:hypothetical protein
VAALGGVPANAKAELIAQTADLLADADILRIGREVGRFVVSVEADDGPKPAAEGQPAS